MTEQNLKYLKWGAGIGLAGLIVLVITKSPTGGSQIDPTTGSGNAPSFNAQKVMTDLLNAMATSGTNETKILKALQQVTPAQFELVFTKFGRRQYNPVLGNQINPIGWFTELDYYDLQQWLEYELSEENYNTLAIKYPNRL